MLSPVPNALKGLSRIYNRLLTRANLFPILKIFCNKIVVTAPNLVKEICPVGLKCLFELDELMIQSVYDIMHGY